MAPLEISNSSIGEEQSPSTITALAWSPLGLAKHKRPVLAVLTSNHLLSLWASTSDMKVPASWQRVYVVNNALHYHLTLSSGHGSSWSRSEAFDERRMVRVRCMAWAPIVNLNDENPSEDQTNGQAGPDFDLEHQPATYSHNFPAQVVLAEEAQLLAIANDCGGVVLLRISSPYTNKSESWGVNLIEQCSGTDTGVLPSLAPKETLQFGHGSIIVPAESDAEENHPSRPSLLATAMARRNFVEQLVWGFWASDNSKRTFAIALTMRINRGLSVSIIHIDADKGELRFHTSEPEARRIDTFEQQSGVAICCRSVGFIPIYRSHC